MGAMATPVPSPQCDDYHYVPECKYDGGDCYFHFRNGYCDDNNNVLKCDNSRFSKETFTGEIFWQSS